MNLPGTDRGIDGFYQAVEIDQLTAERVRIRQIVQIVRWQSYTYRVVGISTKYKPTNGGAVVKLEAYTAESP